MLPRVSDFADSFEWRKGQPKRGWPVFRRMLAVLIATLAFNAFGVGWACESSNGYQVLLAIVFAPVFLVWCNVHRSLLGRVIETIGWLCLGFFTVVAVGSM